MFGLLALPDNRRLGKSATFSRESRVADHIISFPIDGPAISFQLSHGLLKPFPSLLWCCLSLASSGVAPVIVELETVAAYRAAAVAELAIEGEVEKDRVEADLEGLGK